MTVFGVVFGEGEIIDSFGNLTNSLGPCNSFSAGMMILYKLGSVVSSLVVHWYISCKAHSLISCLVYFRIDSLFKMNSPKLKGVYPEGSRPPLAHLLGYTKTS